MNIKNINKKDLNSCLAIYQEGLNSGIASFQDPSITLDEFRIKVDLDKCLILEDNKNIKGYAFFTKVSNRCVYDGVGEVSIYLSKEIIGKGYGKNLLNELIGLSENLGFWSLHSMIFPHNTRSVKLHEKCGFRVLGVREKIGKMTYGPYINQWIDNIYMERRSSKFQD